MKPTIDPALEALTGSRTRLLALAVLASSSGPLTGYRVASIADLPRTKVYAELRWGLKFGLVGRSHGRYLLIDEDIRRLLRKRIRLVWGEEWFSGKDHRETEVKRMTTRLRRMPTAKFRTERGWAPRHPEIFRERATKDRTLHEMGLRTSSHG